MRAERDTSLYNVSICCGTGLGLKCSNDSLSIFWRGPVSPFLSSPAAVGPGAPSRRHAGALPSSASGVDPTVLSLHPGPLAGEAPFVGGGVFAGQVVDAGPAPPRVMPVVVVLAPCVSLSELGEVAALGGRLPLLVGLVRVLVGEVGRLGPVVLGTMGRSATALVVRGVGVLGVVVCVQGVVVGVRGAA